MTQLQKTLEAKACSLYDYDRNIRDPKAIERWANEYCKYSDMVKANPDDDDAVDNKEIYFSALLLKFWNSINMLYTKTRTVGGASYDDFISIVYERIEYACKYRAWQKPGAKVNAQACINQAISTEVKNIYYRANLDKYRANSACNKTSIDTPLSENDDKDLTLADTFTDNSDMAYSFDSQFIIQRLIDDNNVIEAIIADIVDTKDCDKNEKISRNITDENGEMKKVVFTRSSFSARNVVNFLNNLPNDYSKYFSKKYKVKKEILDAGLNKISTSNNNKLYKYISSMQDKLRSIYA